MGEDGRADVAGPHPERGRQLTGHFRMASEMLAETSLVDVKLAAHGARVIGGATLGCNFVHSNMSKSR